MAKKFTISIELTEKQATTVCEHSLERVINQTLRMLELIDHEESIINEDDWLDLKIVVSQLWYKLQASIFEDYNS
jgi:hypothetical protein